MPIEMHPEIFPHGDHEHSRTPRASVRVKRDPFDELRAEMRDLEHRFEQRLDASERRVSRQIAKGAAAVAGAVPVLSPLVELLWPLIRGLF